MTFWNKIFKSNNDPIPTGRATAAGINRYGTLSPHRSRTADVLKTLRKIPEESQAIDFLKRVNPDVSLAVWNFLRLSNQGHEMHFYDKDNRIPRIENMWRDFAARINEISNAGLDGLIDILHLMAFIRGAQAIEVEVSEDRADIVDVYPVIPQTIIWEIEERNGRKVYIPYQQQGMRKASLEKGKANFFWVPTDPDPDDPRGNLTMAPVLQAVDFQIQILQDLSAVLHHQGWPRNDIKILLERLINYMPPEAKSSPDKQRKWIMEKWQEIKNTMENIDPDSDYIHFDDIEINMNHGANAARSLDVRAIAELVDIQTLSGAKQMSIFMNRNQGITESWGSIQFMIFCDGIASIQRGSKRLIEEIARLWLRVHGIQGIPVFTHNKVDWKSEEQRLKAKLMEEQFWAIAQLMNWCDGDRSASEVIGAEKAVGEPDPNRIRVSFNMGDDSFGDHNEQLQDKLPDFVLGKKASYLR